MGNFCLAQWFICIRKFWRYQYAAGYLVDRSNKYFPSEIYFLLHLLFIRVKYNLNLHNDKFHAVSYFHLIPRHGFSLSQPAFSHWIFENFHQLRVLNCKNFPKIDFNIFVRRCTINWQLLLLNV